MFRVDPSEIAPWLLPRVALRPDLTQYDKKEFIPQLLQASFGHVVSRYPALSKKIWLLFPFVLNIVATNERHRNDAVSTKQEDNQALSSVIQFEVNNKTADNSQIQYRSESGNNDALSVTNREELSYTRKIEINNDPEESKTEKVDHEFDNYSDDPSDGDVEEAVDVGMRMMHELYFIKEPQLYKMGLFLNEDEAAGKVAKFSAPNAKAQLQARFGYAAIQASHHLKHKYPEARSKRNPEDASFIHSPSLSEQCPLRGTPRCSPASQRYRTADGTCNNPKDPWMGASMLPMQRFLLPSYSDGVENIRQSVKGTNLPSAREVSIRIHRDRDVEMSSVTMMFMQWGQFLDHDMTSTAQARAFNNSIPRCCASGGSEFLPPEFLHPECLPIAVPEEDWFLARFGIRCLEFVRSAPSSRINCDLGWREQINQVTSYIDASTVYGSDPDRSDSLRVFRNGLLLYGRSKNVKLNPPDPPDGERCRLGALSMQCFQGGDGRAGEQPGLTAFHTVWLRYHNRLASILSKLNPHWSDEKLYQESRRVVGAMIQHITYNEFLPVLLGPKVIDSFELTLLRKGYYEKYDSRVNPAPASSFSAAAFRFGHSLVQNSYARCDGKHRFMKNNVSIHEEHENFDNIWSFGSLDRLILGFINQPSQRRDEFIGKELTSHLFQSPGQPFGMDLAAINIQRGRDHGIPPYTAWREPCGLSPVFNWNDLEPLMSFETVQRLRSLYQDVDDIDLYPGGLAEKPVRGGIVGPTFACIIAQQFLNLRRGDRFWYENGGFESSFTPAQLQQIRRVAFAQILCQVVPEIETIQPFVFLSPDNAKNTRLNCESPVIENFEFRAWEERKFVVNVNNKFEKITKEPKKNIEEILTNNKIDNKLDFNGFNKFVDDKLDFNTNTRQPLESFDKTQNISNKIEFSVQRPGFPIKQMHRPTSPFWQRLTNPSLKLKRSTDEEYEYYDDTDEAKFITDEFYDDDDEATEEETQTKRKKQKYSQKRSTTLRSTTKQTAYRPYSSDNQTPFKIRLTNITTATVDLNQKKYLHSYYTTDAPTYNDDFYVLHPTIIKNNNRNKLTYLSGFASETSSKSPDYQFNINIQYLVSSTPKTDIFIKKGNGQANVHIIENGSPSFNNDKQRPLPIKPIKQPGYTYQFSSTHKPVLHDRLTYDYDELYDYSKIPIYYDGAYSTNRPTYNKFEEKPFSTSKRPYIYRPSESYLSMFDELRTTTRRPIYVTSYVDKVTKRPSFPSYLYLDRLHKDPAFNNANKNTDHSQVYYVGEKNGYLAYERDSDQGDKNFVKISSVQGNQLITRINKEHIINTAQQKEGDLDLLDNIEPVLPPEVSTVQKILIDVIPQKNRKNDWILYNEVEDGVPVITQPMFRSVLNETNTPEVPKPFKNFWRKQVRRKNNRGKFKIRH